MGNGAQSRPGNPTNIQPANDFIRSQRSCDMNGYVANGGETNHGIFQPYDGVQSQHFASPFTRNEPSSYHSGPYDSADHFDDYEVDMSIERAVAPHSRSCSQSYRGMDRPDGPVYRSTSKGVYEQSKIGNRNRLADQAGGISNSTSDDIVFEVFHCLKTGKDYSVINLEGQRYFVDSWNSGNELQPFPEEWYQHGYIESDQRLETGEYGYDDTAHGAAMQSQSAWVPRWKDDRMGLMEHPSRGLLTTYFEETKLNVLSVYDQHSGTWLKMPLSWEMYVPDVKSRLVTIQETFPYWTDTSEILALLRQCNYDLDEVLNTYMTLFEDANPTEEKTPLKLANSSAISKEQAVEMEGLTKRIGQLEEQLRDKDSQLQESQRKNLDLQEKLRSAEELARKLQIKGTSLQREIQQLKSAQTQPQQPVVATVAVATPKEKRVSKDTCLNIKSSIKFFSEKLAELRNCFSSEMDGLYSVLNQAQGSLRKMKQQNQGSSKELIELRALYHKEVLERKLLYNKLQELRGNIRVFCRCRFDPNADDVLNFSTDQDISLVSAMGQKKSFRFDRVFFPTSTQEEVFQDTLPLITSCVDGYNVCIMAYGQTGSGKTYTMMGTNEDPGVNIRSILELLRVCDERTTVDYTMCVSMVEVYNETVRDLLSESGSSQQLTIQMRNKQLVITDVTEANVKSAADIKGIMEKGDSNRSVGATKMNTNSSRSHLLLLLKLHGTDRVTNAVTRGTLTLVDLAGSERISKTEATGQRLVEAAAINKSLSALGQVFAALRTNAMHVPYRNSKLTQLMQSSLGGDGKACLFVNVSPLASNLSETASTLQFGSAAKQVELGKAKQNIT